MITKSYFIFGPNYIRYDATTDSIDAGYPKSISSNWTGFSAAQFESGIEAAVNDDGGKVYFFKDNQYLRYDILSNRVDAGYPLSIRDQWNGLAAVGFDSNIDAAVNWGGGKLYLFRGNQYVRYDLAADKMDDGYPRLIADGWPGFAAAGFTDALDTVVNWGNGKVYFFRNDQYLRYDIATDKVDGGYPANIGDGWAGFAALGKISASWTLAGLVGERTDFSYLTSTFFTELKGVCSRLGCAPEDLLGVMESESGVQPWRQNLHGKATGLIQFEPDILVGLGWNNGPDAFSLLSAEEQLRYVEKFYRPYKGMLTSAGRLYQATFLPITLPDSDESSVICAPGGPNGQFYEGNKVLDTNKDGSITVSDLTARVEHIRQGNRWESLIKRLNA